MIFHNGKILIDGKLVSRDIEVKDGLIAAIEPKLEGEGIDLKGNYVCPGLTDIHVHFREPGNSHKESILTGSKAAAKGGYTTVCLMPNLKPCPDSLEHLKVEEDIIAKDAVVECLPYASVTVGEKGEELSDIDELSTLTALFSDDGVGIQDLSLLGNALDKVASKDLFIASHAEDNVFKTKPEGEYIAVRREIEEAKKHKAPYHFCHMSTKESFEAIKAAQKEGYKITCERKRRPYVPQRNEMALGCDTIGSGLAVDACRSGEGLRLAGSRGRRSVKRLCAERGIDPVERDRLPAIYAGERLAAVWPLGADEEFLPRETDGEMIIIKLEKEKSGGYGNG